VIEIGHTTKKGYHSSDILGELFRQKDEGKAGVRLVKANGMIQVDLSHPDQGRKKGPISPSKKGGKRRRFAEEKGVDRLKRRAQMQKLKFRRRVSHNGIGGVS